MKGFLLDSNGDVVISNRQIQMIEGNALMCQKVKLVLGTNKGEWPLNEDEGISFQNIYNPKHRELQNDQTANKLIEEMYAEEVNSIKSDNAMLSQRLEDGLEGN